MVVVAMRGKNGGNGITTKDQRRMSKVLDWRGKQKSIYPVRSEEKREGIVFVLDTNVLMTKPESLFGFEEHDVYLPWKVLLELDKNKRGDDERNMNARRAIEYIVTLIERVPRLKIKDGISLVKPGEMVRKKCGKLFIATPNSTDEVKKILDPTIADHAILLEFLETQNKEKHVGKKLVLVTKDKVMRILAALLNVPAEDYFADAIDTTKLTPGIHDLPLSVLLRQKKQPEEKAGRQYYTLTGEEVQNVEINEVLSFPADDGFNTIDFQVVEKTSKSEVVARLLIDYRKVHLFGVRARNREQSIALNFLLDPTIKVVILEGPAGSGKNFITLLAAYYQIFYEGRYEQIIATRDAIPVGEQLGFKPGSEEEKMLPWMGGMVDNVSQLQKAVDGHKTRTRKKMHHETDGKTQLDVFLRLIELNSIRGRSFSQSFIIFDENQNSTREQQRLVLTRHGDGSKTVCLGNFRQTDRMLTARTSGFARVISLMGGVPWGVHLVMPKVERSKVAEFFEKNL